MAWAMPPCAAAVRRVLFLLLLAVPQRSCEMDLVLLEDVDPLAVCVDGTPAGYYWDEGPEQEGDTVYWLVYLQGGFWCWSEKSCSERCDSQPQMCSSTPWERTMEGYGILSSQPANSLWAAHKVSVASCTSDSHMGDGAAWGFQFRGARVVQAVLTHLISRGLGGGNKRHVLVFGGGSAGARGAMVHLDYLPQMLGHVASNVQVIGLLDSPLWVDVSPLAPGVASFAHQSEHVFKHYNVSHTGKECAAAYKDEGWKCIFGEYRMQYVRNPYLLVASQFDAFQMGWSVHAVRTYLYGKPHLSMKETSFAAFLATRIRVILGDLVSATHAVFSFACWSHAVSGSDLFYQDRLDAGTTLNDAMRKLLKELPAPGTPISWLQKNMFQWVDGCTGVSCGSGCTALTIPTTTSTPHPAGPKEAMVTATTREPPKPVLLTTEAPAELTTPAPKRLPYGNACKKDSDCRSGLCGASCTARNASCVCPVSEREDDGVCIRPWPSDDADTCSGCCATVSREDVGASGHVCVADSLASTADRRASSSPHSSGSHRRLSAMTRSWQQPHPAIMEPQHGAPPPDAAKSFGAACRAWSECGSGICGASCNCDGQAVGHLPCTCACASQTDEVSEATVPSCCAFFVGSDPCASSCPPCSESECSQLSGDCRWACTAGQAAGECSARPEAFLTDKCQKCCNANFCKANSTGLRGDWIVQATNSGPWPGLDRKGDDLWTREELPCPMGHAWVGGSCQVACELPPGIVLHRILDLGNSTWFEDVALSDGAVIHAACEPGHQGSKDLWTLRCQGGTWKGIEHVDCGPVHCPVPMDPVGLWIGRGEYNQTLRLQCAKGYAPKGGAVQLRCERLGPWQVAVARCMPAASGLPAAQAFRKGTQSAALVSVIGSVSTVSLVMVLCWREPAQKGRPPRSPSEEAPQSTQGPWAGPEQFMRAGLGRGGGLE